MWGADAGTNSIEAIKRLVLYEDSYGQLTFEKLQEWVKAYPTAYYPMFKLQTSIMRTSFGEEWWNRTLSNLQEKEAKSAALENMNMKEKNKSRGIQLIKEKEMLVYHQMGAMTYYLMWWKRKKIRSRVGDIVPSSSRDCHRNADILSCFDD